MLLEPVAYPCFSFSDERGSTGSKRELLRFHAIVSVVRIPVCSVVAGCGDLHEVYRFDAGTGQAKGRLTGNGGAYVGKMCT